MIYFASNFSVLRIIGFDHWPESLDDLHASCASLTGENRLVGIRARTPLDFRKSVFCLPVFSSACLMASSIRGWPLIGPITVSTPYSVNLLNNGNIASFDEWKDFMKLSAAGLLWLHPSSQLVLLSSLKAKRRPLHSSETFSAYYDPLCVVFTPCNQPVFLRYTGHDQPGRLFPGITP